MVEEDSSAVDMFALVREIKEMGAREVNLSGGEVVLFKGFWDLIASGGGEVPWSITTNGTVMASGGNLEKLKRAGVRRLYVSLDSHVPELHDRSRGTPGMFAKVMRSVAAVRDSGWDLEIIVNHVVTRLNAGSIAEFLEFFAMAGIDGINLIPVKDAPDLYVDPESIRAFYGSIRKGLETGRIERGFFLNGNYEIFGRSEPDFLSASAGEYRFAYKSGCAIPSVTLFVDGLTGNVYPCDTTFWRPDAPAYVMGNLAEETLASIWKGERFRAFRDSMFPKLGHPCHKQCDPNNFLPNRMLEAVHG
jgi:MoaA/NifB/PqqE/SkfB family radical SAM enzyme